MEELVLLSHGDGGLLTHNLIEQYFLPRIGNELLNTMEDAVTLDLKSERILITVDGYVVDPLFFPGGDIGKLSVFGTVNDLSVSGAKPLYIAASFIIEEGLPLSTLEKVIASMSEACKEAGVKIVAGDTKVVGKNQADKIFITTTGVGILIDGIKLGKQRILAGDEIIVNGPIGSHGLCILLERGKYSFSSKVRSDCSPLNSVIEAILLEFKDSIKYMRDLTRGGLATCLKEIAVSHKKIDIFIEEIEIPVEKEVVGICEILGLDPLYLANEGKFVIFVDKRRSEELLYFMKENLRLTNAKKIGKVKDGSGNVFMKTKIGGTRRLNMLLGNPLPRIC